MKGDTKLYQKKIWKQNDPIKCPKSCKWMHGYLIIKINIINADMLKMPSNINGRVYWLKEIKPDRRTKDKS